MWANAQRDGRPAEYRRCPLFKAADWLTPTTSVPCSRPNADLCVCVFRVRTFEQNYKKFAMSFIW